MMSVNQILPTIQVAVLVERRRFGRQQQWQNFRISHRSPRDQVIQRRGKVLSRRLSLQDRNRPIAKWQLIKQSRLI